jgi:hypothetical protein
MKVTPTVYVEPPEDMDNAELQANADGMLEAVANAVRNDGLNITENYTMKIERVGDSSIKISVRGFDEKRKRSPATIRHR